MKINKILVAAAMALGFVSCSSEGELTPAIDTLKILRCRLMHL